MSSAGTVNGRGFVISYSVQSGVTESGFAIGGYNVTVDSTDVATCNEKTYGNGGLVNNTANGSHLFFTSKIALAFKTGAISNFSATGSGNMKYILGS